MLTDHDERRIRCRRLGHEVVFRYCRTQEGASLCPLILDCWWEAFDVAGFLRAHLTAEQFQPLARRQPLPKVLTLLEMVRQAQEGAREKPGQDAAQASPSAEQGP